MADKTQVQTKKVTLTAPHEHAGVQYSAGDTVEVDPATADWLKRNGVTGKPDATTTTEEDRT